MTWIDGGNPGATMAPALQDRPGHISWSQVKALHPAYERSCPAAWAYSRRLGIPGDDGGPGLWCGKAADAGAQAFLVARLCEGRRPLDATASAIEVAGALMVDSPDVWGGKFLSYAAAVTDGVKALCREIEDEDVVEVQGEYLWTLPDTDVRVVSYTDWIRADGTIVDLKWTGSSVRDRDGAMDEQWLLPHRRQVVSYWMARAATIMDGRDINGLLRALGELVVVYHNVRNKAPQVYRVPLALTRGEAEIVRQHMIETDAIAAGDHYAARPGKPCERCAFQTRCRRDLANNAPHVEDLADA